MLYSQPQNGPVGIDWGNPLSKAIAGAYLAPSGDALGASVSLFGAATQKVSTPRGLLLGGFTGSTSDYALVNHPKVTGAFTVAFTLSHVVNTSASQAYVSQGGAGVGNGWAIGSSAGSGSLSGLYIVFGGVAVYTIANNCLTSGTTQRVVVRISGNNGTATAWINGAQVGSIGVGTMQTPAGTTTLLGCASNGSNVDPIKAGSAIGDVLIWQRALQDSEIRADNASPWQLFADEEEDEYTLYVQTAGGPTYTLSAASGAIPISGAAASLKAARKLTAASGALTVAGASAGLTASRKLAASSGQINISGAAANLVAARRLGAASGAIPVTGGAAGLRAARKLTAASGSLAIVGRAANLVYTPISGATYTLSCGSGAIPISGGSASLIVARKLVASSGALAIVGQAVSLKCARRLVASGGAISITGAGANLRAARRLLAGGGSLAINGAAAVLQYSGAGAITDPSTYVSLARTVTFEGLGATTAFEGYKTTVAFEGQTTLVRF